MQNTSPEWFHLDFNKRYPSKTAQANKQKFLEKFCLLAVIHGSHAGSALLVEAKRAGKFKESLSSKTYQYNAGDKLLVMRFGSLSNYCIHSRESVIDTTKKYWINKDGQLTTVDFKLVLLAPDYLETWKFTGKLPDGLIKGLEYEQKQYVQPLPNVFFVRTTEGLVGVKEGFREMQKYCRRKDLDDMMGEGIWYWDTQTHHYRW
jgi:hypothetical protein